MMRQFRSPSRWTWILPVIATAFIAACDNALEGINQTQTWGFITVGATKNTSGAHVANTEGLFFSGNLAAVPNADYTTADTCTDAPFSAVGGDLVGVTYLDAGPSVAATVGGIPTTLDRTTTTRGLAYHPSAPISYTPGDSIVIDIQGVPGGYPAGNIRAKTAEAFDFPTNIEPPGGTLPIELTWTQPDDPRSAMVVSLRYATAANPSVLTRNVLCNFIDDGSGTIPFQAYQTWSMSPGVRSVVATRLRTNYLGVGEANLGVISTYQVPTPATPPNP